MNAHSDLPATYSALVALHRPRPIREEADLEMVYSMLDRLVGFDLTADQEDYMDALATFVKQYEDAHYPM